MIHPARVLAIAALTTLIGCSSAFPSQSTSLAPTVVLRIYSTPDTAPLLISLAQAYRERQPNSFVEMQSASHEALLNQLEAGDTPFFISQHLPQSSGLWVVPLAQDGIAVITHPTNAISQLSTDQLRQIYQGVIDDWGALGVPSQPITLFSYESGSDMRGEFERLVMGRRRITANALAIPSAEAAQQRVAATPGGIAYVAYSQLTEAVRVIAINRILPTPQTLSANAYPLRTTLFLIGLREPDAEYRAFIEWMQSANGQERLAPFIPLPR